MADRPAILGLPLDAAEDDLICTGSAFAAVVVAKVLDGDGNVRTVAGATLGLSLSDALGMARYAVLRLERGLMREGEDE